MNKSIVKRVALASFSIVVGGAVFLAYQPKPIQVDVAQASRGVVEVVIEEDGKTRVKDHYVIRCPLSANLSRLQLNPGDPVTPGQELARLAPVASPLLDARSQDEAHARVAAATAARRQALSLVERTKAALEFATKEHRRQQGLAKKGSISPVGLERAALQMQTLSADLASAGFAAKVSEHQLKLARIAIGKGPKRIKGTPEELVLNSPVSGVVLAVLERGGGVVSIGTPIIEVGDSRALEVVVDVLTTDAVRLKPGKSVRITHWGGGRALPGHIRLIEPRAFTRVSSLGVEEQRVNVVVDLDAPYKQFSALGDGYRVEAQLLVDRQTDTLRIPESAVFRDRQGWATFVVTGGRATHRPITVGHRNAKWVEVTSGLKASERVIVHPSDSVQDGRQIELRAH